MSNKMSVPSKALQKDMSASKITKKSAAMALAKNNLVQNVAVKDQIMAIDNAYDREEEVGAIEGDERVQRILQ